LGKANVRVTISKTGGKFSSREPGTKVAIQVNSFGLQSLQGISGQDMVPLLLNAMEPAAEQAEQEWPKDTHASVDSMDLEVMETGPKVARVALTVGGDQLIQDPRNVKGIDYAPFIEFNGTATAPPGVITSAIIMNESKIKERLRQGLKELIRSKLGQ
jgi:hypothetical protein